MQRTLTCQSAQRSQLRFEFTFAGKNSYLYMLIKKKKEKKRNAFEDNSVYKWTSWKT